jgi:Zn-dependent alcohol dehydrogenase
MSIRTTAAVFHGADQGLRIEPVDVGPPVAGEVRLRLAACGACLSDVHKLRGHGLVAPPHVFGHEISGTITQVGDGVGSLAVGDRVVCTFLVPCGDCDRCRSGASDECGPFRTHLQREGVRFDGSHRMALPDGSPLRTSGVGGLAGELTMPATAVYQLPADWPSDVSLEDAAVLGCAGLTAYGAVHGAGGVSRGQRVLVIGSGGVGLCVTALAVDAGAVRVVATDLRDEALAAQRDFGAHATIRGDDPEAAARVREALGSPDGADVVIDTIGTPATVSQALQLAAVGGRVVVSGLGGTSGPATIDDITVFVRRKLRLIGSYAAVPSRDMPRLLEAVARGALDPSRLVSRRFAFEDVAAAYDALANGLITGRALVLGPSA